MPTSAEKARKTMHAAWVHFAKGRSDVRDQYSPERRGIMKFGLEVECATDQFEH